MPRSHSHSEQKNAVDDSMFDTSDDALANAQVDVLNSSAQGQLKAFVERIERLEEDEAAIKTDKKEVYAELKGNGFDPKIVRIVIKRRAQDAAKRQEQEALVDLYESAIG